jgi:periplasmic protein TonB
MKTLSKALNKAVNAENIEDIIFENRNHEYGAYALRRNYNNRVSLSLLVVVSLASLLTIIAFTRSMNKPSVAVIQKPPDKIIIAVTPADDIPLPPATDFKIIKKLYKQESFAPPVIVDKPSDGNEPLMDSDLKDFLSSQGSDNLGNITYITSQGDPGGTAIPVDTVFDITQVQEQAMFRGGTVDDFRIWLIKNMRYPAGAEENDLFGTVYLKFTVGKSGKITDVVIQRSIHPILDQAAVLAIKNSPEDWRAARINGYPVNSSYTVPIKFNLQK